MKAIWNGIVLAESDKTIMIEGNYYFPPDSVNRDYFGQSALKTRCIWKGQAHYYDIEVQGEVNYAAAWHYPKPWLLARFLKDYVAFWNGVQVVRD
ncbi:MAG: DUF427 domain-containing protein [Anaerolineae bacterium]|nr:DUF427 domain-containing protein [Anaerolineae bacterium]